MKSIFVLAGGQMLLPLFLPVELLLTCFTLILLPDTYLFGFFFDPGRAHSSKSVSHFLCRSPLVSLKTCLEMLQGRFQSFFLIVGGVVQVDSQQEILREDPCETLLQPFDLILGVVHSFLSETELRFKQTFLKVLVFLLDCEVQRVELLVPDGLKDALLEIQSRVWLAKVRVEDRDYLIETMLAIDHLVDPLGYPLLQDLWLRSHPYQNWVVP